MHQLKQMDDFISEKIEAVEKLKAESEYSSLEYAICVSKEIAYQECLTELRRYL